MPLRLEGLVHSRDHALDEMSDEVVGAAATIGALLSPVSFEGWTGLPLVGARVIIPSNLHLRRFGLVDGIHFRGLGLACLSGALLAG